jgi:hypothetical protein
MKDDALIIVINADELESIVAISTNESIPMVTDICVVSGSGLFFPVWRSGGAAFVDCISPPSWALGAYLKESKSDCCEAYSVQLDECLAA